ncbi:hypothetical protein FAUST_12005, partial [Fusarium austroamericanum]
MAASSKPGSPRARDRKSQPTRLERDAFTSTSTGIPRRKSGVREGKKLEIPEDPGIRSVVTVDLLQWLEAIELQIDRVREKTLQPLLDKLSEEERIRCEAEKQFKLVEAEKEQASKECSELKAQTQALEEKLKTSQDELKKLQETQDARIVLLPECQGVRECPNKDVQEQGRPPKYTGDVLNEREIYLKNMWDDAAEQREAAMDQATVYKRDMNVVMQKNHQLEIDNAELAERLERTKSDAFTQKVNLEKAEKESKRLERGNTVLMEEKDKLRMEKAELIKKLETSESDAIRQKLDLEKAEKE